MRRLLINGRIIGVVEPAQNASVKLSPNRTQRVRGVLADLRSYLLRSLGFVDNSRLSATGRPS